LGAFCWSASPCPSWPSSPRPQVTTAKQSAGASSGGAGQVARDP
jgi:hypothetical protein